MTRGTRDYLGNSYESQSTNCFSYFDLTSFESVLLGGVLMILIWLF